MADTSLDTEHTQSAAACEQHKNPESLLVHEACSPPSESGHQKTLPSKTPHHVSLLTQENSGTQNVTSILPQIWRTEDEHRKVHFSKLKIWHFKSFSKIFSKETRFNQTRSCESEHAAVSLMEIHLSSPRDFKLESTRSSSNQTLNDLGPQAPTLDQEANTNGRPESSYFSKENARPNSSEASRQTSADKFKPLDWLIFLLDIIGAYFWVGPLVVLYWNSTWRLSDEYIFKESYRMSAWISTVIGLPLFALASLIQHKVSSFSSRCRRPVRYCLMRLYSYIGAFVCVQVWRGIWLLQDYYFEISILNASLTCSVAVFCLVLLRSLRVASAPPASICLDIQHSVHYQMTTFLSSQPGTMVYFLDTILTIFVVHSLMITLWRGIWELMDILLCPKALHMSAIWSLVISYGLAFILILIQNPSKKVWRRLQGLHWMLIIFFEDMIVFLYVVVCITQWRGFWLLLDVYNTHRPVSLWVGHGLGFTFLVLGMAANSLLVRGCPRDGLLSDGRGLVPDNTYLSTLLHGYRQRAGKESKRKRQSSELALESGTKLLESSDQQC